jgi:hypothetical protein
MWPGGKISIHVVDQILAYNSLALILQQFAAIG